MERYTNNEITKIEKDNKSSLILTTPFLIWITFFFLIPYLIVIFYSVLTPGVYDIKFIFSLESWKAAFSSSYLDSITHSLVMSLLTTIITILIGFPVAYVIANSSKRKQNLFIVLIIIPFWTNFIIRIFSWKIFLSAQGLLNNALIYFGLIDEPLMLLRTNGAVLLVMVYVYLPYMILPIYSVLEKFNYSLLEASMDLGANEIRSFFKITLPLSMEGIFAGSILVFIPALGTYIIPQLVGHQSSAFIGQLITFKVKSIPRNWPLASALSFILLLLVAVILFTGYNYYKQGLRRK
ncbi:ABC transporter permease [bacterium]|nr:ABC transporter permease [bacterium]